MFSKVLAGVLGLAVVSVGGFVVYQYGTGAEMSCCKSRAATADVSAETTSCCADLSRTDAVHSCCSDKEPAVTAVTADGVEVLAIAPREVK